MNALLYKEAMEVPQKHSGATAHCEDKEPRKRRLRMNEDANSKVASAGQTP